MKKKYKVIKRPKNEKKVARNGGGINNFRATHNQYYSNDPWNLPGTNNGKTNGLNTSTNNSVKTTYEEVEEENANVEAEKGETILKADGQGFYKIGGKSHSKGGTFIHADKNDFIFSKKLKLKGDVLQDEFGNFNPKKDFSIADVSKKYLKLNKFKDMQTSKDSLDRATGELMQEKYLDKLGKLALLQEADKGFPGGVPQISLNVLGIQPDALGSSTVEPELQLQLPVIGEPVIGQEQELESNDNQELENENTPEFQDGGAAARNEKFGKNSNIRPVDISDNWKKVYANMDKYIAKNYPDSKVNTPIDNHFAYQKAVKMYGDYQLLSLIQNNQMPLTNKGKKALGITKKGDVFYKDIPKDKLDLELGDIITTSGSESLEEFLLDQFVDGLPGHRRIEFKEGDLTKEQVLERGFENYDFLEDSNLYIDKNDIDEGDGSFTFYTPINNAEAELKSKKQPLDVITDEDLEKKKIALGNGSPTSGGYRDLGFSTPENLTLASNLLTISSIPKHEPTRFQNYGLQQALGLASNVMPYNYQSSINESNRAGLQSIRANNQISPNSSIAAARNASVTGQIAENNSRIKGDEYNQNANLFNNNQLQLANFTSQIGADKEQQGSIYVDKVNQTNENYWANRLAARNNFTQNLGEAYERRGLRNTLDFYAQSRIPNYRIQNADGVAGFVPMQDPLGTMNRLAANNNNNTTESGSNQQEPFLTQSEFNKFMQFVNMTSSQKKELEPYSKVVRRLSRAEERRN